MKPIKLLVYGTLKKGYALNGYLTDSKRLGVGTLKGYEMYSNNYYPMIIKSSDANACITGEVYEITNEETLKALDLVEGQYIRTKVEVELDDEIVEVEIYVYSYEITRESKIVGGVWN